MSVMAVLIVILRQLSSDNNSFMTVSHKKLVAVSSDLILVKQEKEKVEIVRSAMIMISDREIIWSLKNQQLVKNMEKCRA